MGELKGRGTVVLAVACALGAGAGCKRDTTVGAPDSFLLVAPVPPRDGAATATKSKAGLPVVAKVPIDDPHAVPLHQKFAVGFASEVLRTDYLAKQLIRELGVNGHRYSDGQRASAREPTVLIMGGPRAGGPTSRGIALKGSFGGEDEYADVLAAAIDAYPDHDRALSQTLAGTLGLLAASRVAAADAPDPTQPLVVAYARALEVIAREWRDGEGPAGMLPPDAGSAAQRDLFAAVRENRYTLGADGAPRPARELLTDPNVAATVLYRLAQSKTVGRKIAPEAVYAPFVKDRVPEGISPAAVLGPFRNFQAKLLSAWGRAVLEGNPPANIADLVEAYGRALPGERPEITRIFVVTTFGGTVKPGGVHPPAGNPGAALPELTALAAEVAAGKLSAHAALTP